MRILWFVQVAQSGARDRIGWVCRGAVESVGKKMKTRTNQLYLVASVPKSGVYNRWSFITVVMAGSKAEACRLACERDPGRFGSDPLYRKPKAELLVQGSYYAV